MNSVSHPTRVIARRRTPYQQVEMAEHPVYGTQLYIDGDLQISACDRAYATALVAPVLQADPIHEVLILGGGDGGVLAELVESAELSDRTLDHAVMVDIDREVVELCRTHLPQLCGQAFEKDCAELVIGDALSYLEQTRDLDAVIYDLTFDPVREQTSRPEFIEQTVALMAESLRPGGVVSMQCCGVDNTTDGREPEHQELLATIRETATAHFEQITEQQVLIPSYEGLWTFLSARKPEPAA